MFTHFEVKNWRKAGCSSVAYWSMSEAEAKARGFELGSHWRIKKSNGDTWFPSYAWATFDSEEGAKAHAELLTEDAIKGLAIAKGRA